MIMKKLGFLAMSLSLPFLGGSVFADEAASYAGVGQYARIPVPRDLRLQQMNEDQARATLNALDVKYLWKMNGQDVETAAQAPGLVVYDFMNHVAAHSEGLRPEVIDQTSFNEPLVTEQDCLTMNRKHQSVLVDRFVQFERISPDQNIGGSLVVDEKDPGISQLNREDSFTIGGWVKLNTASDIGNQLLEPSFFPQNFMPILSKTVSNLEATPDHAGNDWIVHLTSQGTYLNINRNNTKDQNDMNISSLNTAWWADTYGSCYTNGNHDECWHYFSISVNPSQNTVQFVFLRKNTALRAGMMDFVQTQVTNSGDNQILIRRSEKARLRIGGNGFENMHGLMRGVFLAKRALSPSESKAIALYTEPTAKGFYCQMNELQKSSKGIK